MNVAAIENRGTVEVQIALWLKHSAGMLASWMCQAQQPEQNWNFSFLCFLWRSFKSKQEEQEGLWVFQTKASSP